MTHLVVIACIAFDHRAPADGLKRFKACITQCPQVERTMEVCGTFDLIVQGRCSDLADYTKGMESLAKPLAQYVSRIETSFVARTVDRPAQAEETGALWLPCRDGRRRVEYRRIDKIVAEGDYMRVHVGAWSGLIHETMGRLKEEMAGAGFVQLHRSWLVRIAFIDKLIHDQKRWIARLLDGTEVAVAKSHTQDVLRIVAGESSSARGVSANSEPVAEPSPTISESRVKVPL